MPLHQKKRIIWAVIILIIVTVLALGVVPTGLQLYLGVFLLGLLAVEALLCLCLLRCPHCHGQLHLCGQTYCPSCGEKIDS